jgi:hypothetical protein
LYGRPTLYRVICRKKVPFSFNRIRLQLTSPFSCGGDVYAAVAKAMVQAEETRAQSASHTTFFVLA